MDAAPPHMQLARQLASNPLLHCPPAFLPPPQKPAASATCSCGGRPWRGARAPHLPVEQARQRARAWSTVGDGWSECTCQPALLRPIPDATPLLFHLAFLRSFLPSPLGRLRMATDEWESTTSPSTLGTPLGSRRLKCIETLAALR